MHKKTHDPYFTEQRKDVPITRALPVSSRTLRISRECDVVEFRKRDGGIKLQNHRGFYEIYPIEYKKGKPKESEEDILQLTARVVCFGEMFSTDIPEGALFYGETRRREVVKTTAEPRDQVKDMVDDVLIL